MRILVVNHEYVYPPAGGHKLAVFTSLRSLARRGHEITHLSWGAGRSTDIYVDEIRFLHQGIETFDPMSVPSWLKAVGSNFFLSQVWRLRDKGLPLKSAMKLLNNETFDIIIHESPDGSPLPYTLSRLFAIPLVERVHWVSVPRSISNIDQWEDYVGVRLISHNKLLSLGRLLAKQIVDKVERGAPSLRKANLILTVSKKDEELMKAWGFSNVQLSLLPYEPMKTAEKNADLEFRKPPYAVFSGPLNQRTNLFSAFFIAKLAREMRKVTFLIAGGDATFFKSFALPQNFVPLGFISPRSHAYMLSVASIVLIPQVLGHGLQTKLAEALAYGKPVITTSVVAEEFPELINGRRLIIEDDPGKWANIITYMLDDEEYLRKISREARDYYMRNLSPDVHAVTLERVLRELRRE
jgi:glycosyltransferase involved in cell wall biosynthesis